MDSLESRVQGWSKQKMKIIGFSIDYDITGPLFTHLWTLSTAFVLMQVKTGFDKLIFNYTLPFLHKSRMISIIYHKYGELFFEIIPLPLPYAMRIPWNNILIYIQSFSLIDCSYFIWFCNEKLCIYFWKKTCLPETRSFV